MDRHSNGRTYQLAFLRDTKLIQVPAPVMPLPTAGPQRLPQLGAPLRALRRRLAIPVDKDPYRTLPPPVHVGEEVDRRVAKDT